MSKSYMYVVDRDFGFAPNPFHGYCTLATCKPGVRSTATIGDWIFGIGGKRLKATGRCIFAMQVTGKITYNDYWNNPIYLDKKPVRNGSSRMLVGDNIYHFDTDSNAWHQADSHHSNPDGSLNTYNLKRDTKSNQVLLSRTFFYFGSEAPLIPPEIISEIGFKNGVGHRVYRDGQCTELTEWLYDEFADDINTVRADPYNFDHCNKRYSGKGSKLV